MSKMNEIKQILTDHEDLRRYLFIRGFLITNAEDIPTEEYPMYGAWKKTELGDGYALYAHPLTTTAEESIWLAPRRDGNGVYAALFNLSDEERQITLPAEYLDKPWTAGTELWTKQPVNVDGGLSADLAPHDAAVYLLR